MIDLKSDSKNDHWYDWCQDHENTHVYLMCWSKIPQDNLTKWSQKQHRKKIKDWITKIPKELFLSLLISKGNKNSFRYYLWYQDTSGIDTVDMIEVGCCNSAGQDLAIADCRRSQSGQPTT
jgi:hypothetical protein